MNLIKLIKKATAVKEKKSTRGLTIFIGFFLVVLSVSTAMQLSEYPWKGNIITWMKAREVYDSANQLRLKHAFSDAEPIYQSAIRIFPDDWRMYNALGLTQLDMNHKDDAEKSFKKAVELNKNKAEVWLNLAYCQSLQEGKLEEADKAVMKALELEPANAEAVVQLALIQQYSGKTEEAEKTFEKVAGLDKDSARFWFLSGKYHVAVEDLQRAEAEFKQAADLDKSNPEYWETLGILLVNQNKHLEIAETCLNYAALLSPGNFTCWKNVADLSRLLGHPDKAEKGYRHALQIDPNNADCLMYLGLSMINQNRAKEAEKPIRKAYSLDAKDQMKWRAVILVLEKEEKYDAAIEELQKFLKVPENSKSWISWKYLGTLYMEKKDYAKAQEALDHALSLAASDVQIAETKSVIAQVSKAKSTPDAKVDGQSGTKSAPDAKAREQSESKEKARN